MDNNNQEFDPSGLLYKALRTHHIKGKVKKYQRIKPEIKYIYRVDVRDKGTFSQYEINTKDNTIDAK